MGDLNLMAKPEKEAALRDLERLQLAQFTGGSSNFGSAGQLDPRSAQTPLVSGSSPSGANLVLIQPIPGCGGFNGC
jgi:hypothetical protein